MATRTAPNALQSLSDDAHAAWYAAIAFGTRYAKAANATLASRLQGSTCEIRQYLWHIHSYTLGGEDTRDHLLDIVNTIDTAVIDEEGQLCAKDGDDLWLLTAETLDDGTWP